MLQTTHYDQLVSLFTSWSYDGLMSFAADQLKIIKGEDAVMQLKRSDMHYFYGIREQLGDCLTELGKEMENNILALARDQHDMIYFKKLAATHNQLIDYLTNDYQKELARFEGVTFDIEPPKKITTHKIRDKKGVEHDVLDEPRDPYWNDYVKEEQLVIEDADVPPVVIRLIKTIAEKFIEGAYIIYRAITESIVYKSHPELIPLIVPKTVSQDNTSSESEAVEKDKGLSAAQKLLLVRLLQQEGLFPKKLANTDDAPELRAIALLTGMNYENDIKGGNGANAKVNLLLDDRSRRSMSVEQAKSKLKDLDAVEKVAQLLNLQPVRSLIDKYRKELQSTLGN